MDVGKHCQMDQCNQKDFLPFTCTFCTKVFCLEHRTQQQHTCQNNNNKRSVSADSQVQRRICPVLNCNTQMTFSNDFKCKKCSKVVCLKHRFEEDHQCRNVTIQAGPEGIENLIQPAPKNKRKGFFFCCYNKPKQKA